MKITVLGCSGGIGRGLNTTSFLVGDDLLIDAGDGVGTLETSALDRIRDIFITHSHLDHICHIPFLVDNLFDTLKSTGELLTLHGQPQTLNAVKKHIFNGVIWPDFAALPTISAPVMRYQVMHPGDLVTLGTRRLEMIPVDHIVPGVAYRLAEFGASFAFSGDTGVNDSLWDALNAHDGLDFLVVEAAFPDSMAELSRLAKHYCPQTLAADLRKLRHRPNIYISHQKPGSESIVMEELKGHCPERSINRLFGGEVFDL